VTPRPRLPLQEKVARLAFITVLPLLLATMVLLWTADIPWALRFTVLAALGLVTLLGLLAVRQSVANPLRTLATLIEALRQGDFSLRGRCANEEDGLGEVMLELNALSHTLYEQRLSAVEAGALVEKVMSEVDIAVFAFDSDRILRRLNRAAEALFERGSGVLVGAAAPELGLDAILDGESGQIISHTFPSGPGRWEIRTRSFREAGKTHELLVISDLSRALREEERLTSQRLVRVMAHEINSSLTPINSVAATLLKGLDRQPLPAGWFDDARVGLTIIHDRAGSLGRFIGTYARFARLPPPTRRPVALTPIVSRAASLYAPHVVVEAGTDLIFEVDPDQIEQVFINLIKNAVEAVEGTAGVRVRWKVCDSLLTFEVEDDGPGLAGTGSLWVPFFTTKKGGSGIGLVLSRQIVENHGGTISLDNRSDSRGCLARIRVPL
jgi:two-component system nitrogen regulation sensor histidine kinase NtrY